MTQRQEVHILIECVFFVAKLIGEIVILHDDHNDQKDFSVNGWLWNH